MIALGFHPRFPFSCFGGCQMTCFWAHCFFVLPFSSVITFFSSWIFTILFFYSFFLFTFSFCLCISFLRFIACLFSGVHWTYLSTVIFVRHLVIFKFSNWYLFYFLDCFIFPWLLLNIRFVHCCLNFWWSMDLLPSLQTGFTWEKIFTSQYVRDSGQCLTLIAVSLGGLTWNFSSASW